MVKAELGAAPHLVSEPYFDLRAPFSVAPPPLPGYASPPAPARATAPVSAPRAATAGAVWADLDSGVGHGTLSGVLYFDEILRLARAALIHSDTHPEVRHYVVRLKTGLEGVAVKQVGDASAEAMEQAYKLRELLTRSPSK